MNKWESTLEVKKENLSLYKLQPEQRANDYTSEEYRRKIVKLVKNITDKRKLRFYYKYISGMEKDSIKSIAELDSHKLQLEQNTQRKKRNKIETTQYHTNEEYKEKLKYIIMNIEDNRILEYFYIYILEKLKRVQGVH